MEEGYVPPEQERNLKCKRTLFVADRVATTFSAMLAASAGLTIGIQVDHNVDRVLSNWWMAIVLPVVGFTLLVSMRRLLFFKFHWGVIALLNGLVWFPPTIIVGLALDKYLVGTGNAFWVSVNLLFAYSLGYVAARWFGIYRHVSKSSKQLFGWIVYVILLLAIGILVFPGLMARVVETLTGGEINLIHFILCAFAVPVSCSLNYYMLYALHDEGGMNVLQDPPNKLFYVCFRNTVVLMLIFWVVLLALFPPLIAGGGGDGGGQSSGSPDSGGVSGGGASAKRAVLKAEAEKARRRLGQDYTMERIINDAWSSSNLGV